MLLWIPHGWGLSLLYFPSPHLKICEYAASDLYLYVNSAHAEKDLSWAWCYLPTPAETFRFMNPISSLRSVRQSESFWCDQCSTTEENHEPYARAEWCGALLILAYMHTRHYCFMFQGCRVHIWLETDTTEPLCVCPRKARDRESGMCVCTCIEMNWEVCVLSSDWSAARMAPREDIGRGQTRLFQIDLSDSASGRSNWLDKGDTFFYYCPCFTVRGLDKPMYYSLVSLGDKWETSDPETLEYSLVCLSLLIPWPQANSLN